MTLYLDNSPGGLVDHPAPTEPAGAVPPPRPSAVSPPSQPAGSTPAVEWLIEDCTKLLCWFSRHSPGSTISQELLESLQLSLSTDLLCRLGILKPAGPEAGRWSRRYYQGDSLTDL